MSEKKARPAVATRRKSNGGTLLGMFVGLVIGVLLSFGVVWYMHSAPLPFRDKVARDERPAEPSDSTGKPVALPGKPGDKPRFEFYKILPANQDANPAPAAAQPEPAKPEVAKKPADSELQFLQAGSFQNAAEADNLKAKLALMGMDASVQEVDVADKGKMHRVRLGPFQSVEEMNRVRGLLSQNGVQAAPVKGKNN